jgi:hypothetical protein
VLAQLFLLASSIDFHAVFGNTERDLALDICEPVNGKLASVETNHKGWQSHDRSSKHNSDSITAKQSKNLAACVLSVVKYI